MYLYVACGHFLPLAACALPTTGNPLLHTCNLPRLSELLHRHNIPLIVDDTIASFANVKCFPYADCIVTSLTKWYGKINLST